MGLIIYHNNMIDGAVLSAGSWDADLSLEMLRDPRPKLRARSTNAQLTSTKFRVGLAGPLTLLGIQLIATNVSNAGRYRVTWYTDGTYVTPAGTTDWQDVGDTIDWSNPAEWLEWEDTNFWLGSEPFVDPDNQGRDIRVTFASSIIAQFFQIEFDDTGNADGYVEIGYAFFGPALQPSCNFSPDGNSFRRASNTTSVRSSGLTRYSRRRPSSKRLVVAWPYLPIAEVLGEIDDMVLVQDIDRPVYVDVFPDNNTIGLKTAFLATIEQLPEHQMQNVFFDDDIAASVAFEFLQVQ